MQYAVAGVYHLYFGDASRHPIVGNYLRSVTDLPQQIVLTEVPASRLARAFALIKGVWALREQRDWALQCHDVVAGVLGSLLWKGRIIYDSHEIYSSFARRKLVGRVIRLLEEFAIRRSTVIVFPSVYRSEYYDLSNCDVRIVENLYYPYERIAKGAPYQHATDSTRDSHSPMFVYTGLFTPARAIEEIVSAFRSPRLQDSRLVLAGKETSYLTALMLDATPNVEYAGELTHAEVSELLKSADAGFALYKPVNENNKRCAPTKIFEFLYFGVHVIASRSPYIMEIKERCGGIPITAIGGIDTDSIVDACCEIEISGKSVDSHLRAEVCWDSQMTAVKSLYM